MDAAWKLFKCRPSTLHCYKEGKTSMTSGDLDLWDMVMKKKICNPGRVLDICAKNEVDPTIVLGGVRPQTHRHTDRGHTAIIV